MKQASVLMMMLGYGGSAFADAAASGTNSSLRLTGIVAIGGYKRACVVHEERGTPPEYFTLREGETVRGWEVRRVDAELGEVHVVCNGKDLLLSLDSQQAAERQARQAERQFVEEHTRAHEELQRRERERLAREQAGL